MSFTLPTFNLNVNVWSSGVDPNSNPPRLTVKGNLAYGRRFNQGGGASGSGVGLETLLLPNGTDVRFSFNSTGADTIEAPAGTKRYYTCWLVDDIGKGFPNEHRAAVLVPTQSWGHWPTPIP